MDLSSEQFDLSQAAGKGIPVEILNPATSESFSEDPDEVPEITILGRDSDKWQQVATKTGRQMAGKYKKTVPGQQIEKSLREVLARCTVSWKNIFWNGEALECNYENALMLYTERPWVAEQLLERASDRASYFLG